MTDLIPIFAEYGLPGAVIGWLVYLLNKKEARIDALTDKLFDKTEKEGERFHGITLTMERILMAVKSDGGD
ncbi:hypothetical protein [Sulfitobacter pacificus]|uniref:YvrJ protein family protein n=1 Tax=Sulfitobacter pacificus TaxID=1499314 RepID=A0ABQ5VGC2_9RHOB|nr:hypothetical protein [Sulfitobacter pacificus]GLQ26144.1 hypothetical protein GCM10007927_09470 [Sulfitobacter pacificus]